MAGKGEVVTADPTIEIDWLGGNCPGQAEGRINGAPFYFRARGASWSLECGDFSYSEGYGVWPDAGWMTEGEAREFIAKAAALCVSNGQPL